MSLAKACRNEGISDGLSVRGVVTMAGAHAAMVTECRPLKHGARKRVKRDTASNQEEDFSGWVTLGPSDVQIISDGNPRVFIYVTVSNTG